MGLDTNVSLLVASLDLQLVRLLRGAMNAANLSAGAQTLSPQDRFEPRQVHEPAPRIEPRKVIHPQPRFEPRPVYHPQPRYEVQPPAPPVEPEQQVRTSKALPPPWKQPVWETPLPAPTIIKVVQHRTDVVNKGSLIDVFC